MIKFQNWKKLKIFILLVLLFLLRFLKLDIDLPPWGIVNYQPMDEGQYATMALNEYNYGILRLDFVHNTTKFVTFPHIRNNIVGNVLVFVGMKLLGDNYYGFRCSSVFVGLLNFILMGAILYNIKNSLNNREGKQRKDYYIVGLLVLFLFDFVYYIACRTVETTIYRLLFLQLFIYVLTIPTNGSVYKKSIRFIIAGFLSVFSVFAVYVTNIFLVFSGAAIVLFYGFSQGRNVLLESMSCFVSGGAIAYIVCDFYYNLVWGTSCIQNTMQIISDFSGVEGYVIEKSLNKYLVIIQNFVSSNSNLYNIVLFFFFLIALIKAIYLIREKNETAFILLITYLLFFLQTLVCEDYIVRKYILVFPLMIYIIYTVVASISYSDDDLFLKKNKFKIILYSSFCVTICFGIVIYRLYKISNNTFLDFSAIDKIVVMSQLFFVLVLEIWIIFSCIRKNTIESLKKIAVLVLLASLIPNIYFITKYVLINTSYTEKELMKEVGKYANNENVYGVYSISFTLYNDIKPVVNYYEDMKSQIKENKDRWYIDYSEYDFPANVIDEKSVWEQCVVFKRNYCTFGNKKQIALYKITY